MKKSFLLMAVFAAVVFSCKKPEPVPEQPADTETAPFDGPAFRGQDVHPFR